MKKEASAKFKNNFFDFDYFNYLIEFLRYI